MRQEKSRKSVSDMGVLKDLRELLSTSQEKEALTVDNSPPALQQKELEDYRRLTEAQKEELEKLKQEREMLLRELETLRSQGPARAGEPEVARLRAEVARLEAYREELTRVVTETEALLRLRLSELLQKVARAFEASGLGEAGLQFRSGAEYLESPEDFAYLLRILLRGAR